MTRIRIRNALTVDIPAIMALERLPGNEAFMGRWNEDEHGAHLADPDFLYLVAEDADAAFLAFAAMSGLEDKSGRTRLNRLAVLRPGQGVGHQMLSAVLASLFARPQTISVWLRVTAGNERAKALYRASGFREDDVPRAIGTLPDGENVELIQMSIDGRRPSISTEALT